MLAAAEATSDSIYFAIATVELTSVHTNLSFTPPPYVFRGARGAMVYAVRGTGAP